ncbi:VOC family protein [Pelagibius sp. CAU 1746]|uniref:VOC family protein n=1 Tax=Pelagibius sp. CAU 1746 TaxID=3140370 RepID=UPI00325AFA4A
METKRKVMPFLWFDDQAEDAAKTYAGLFADSALGEICRYSKRIAEATGRAEGSAMTVTFRLGGQEVTALNGGPQFRFTPSFSFFVNCGGVEEAEALFTGLAQGGEVMMPFQAYPFSAGYGWIKDRYGFSWQVNSAPRDHTIAPSLLFVGRQCGRAEEAMTLYGSIFPDSRIESVARYEAGEAPNAEGSVKHGIFFLAGQELRAMDSALDHTFTFTEAASLQVLCDSQEEVDHYWHHLGEGGDPAAQQCGWLKDRFGVSWQVVPRVLTEMLSDAGSDAKERVTQAFMQMKKFDISALERAYRGN